MVEYEAEDYNTNFQGQQGSIAGVTNIYEVNDMVKLVKEFQTDPLLDNAVKLITNEPQELQQEYSRWFFSFISKSLLLSFVTKEDMQFLYNKFMSARANFLMSVPDYKKTTLTRQILSNLESYFYTQLIRAKGVKGQITNERTMEATSITQSISTHSENQLQKKRFNPMGLFRGMF